MRRFRSSRGDAANALYLLIMVNVLVYTFRDDLRPYMSIYAINNGGYLSMLSSMFSHINPRHLLLNMLALHRYGSEVFVNSSSRTWRSFFTVLLSYLVCGVGSFLGIEWLSSYHDRQWQRKVSSARTASKCTYWMCQTFNTWWGQDVTSLVTNYWADWATFVTYGDEVMAIWQYKLVLRVGASGVVYGFMGMRLITAFVSSHHTRLDALDLFFLVGTLAHDLSMSPISLANLRDVVFFKDDGVDHAAHLFGALVGMTWAVLLLSWGRLFKFPLTWWRGEGRRLGGSWEQGPSDNTMSDEQDRGRREQSRLLNNRNNGGRGRRPPERTML